MIPINTLNSTEAVGRSRRILEDLFAGLRPRMFDVRFWDGSEWLSDVHSPTFTLVLRHPGAVRRMFWPPRSLSFGAAYVYEDFDVEGDILAFQDLCHDLAAVAPKMPFVWRLRLAWRIWSLPLAERSRAGRAPAQLRGPVHSRERDRAAIRYHYDLPALFFEKMLGPTMLYTSGMWESADETLESAQHRKLETICRKLRLKAGDRLLDIGCGWGMLGIYAARNHGVQTVGVTISQAGADWGRARIRAEGLESRCRIEVVDYRNLPDHEQFDKITCIEVGEHFGAAQFPTYWRKCKQLLRPGGAMVHQQIGTAGHTVMPENAASFLQRFIFPDGELLPLNFWLRHAEQAGLEIRESLREHYPLTLKHWLANLEASEHELVAATDEATYRCFRLYLSGAAWGFNNNVYNLYQVLLVKPDQGRSGLPLSRPPS
jgi:cyclopropane-fatty-acyl-phospholipid synthase